MPLPNDGLIKLAEECGELVQAAMKRITCSDETHWDGSNLKERLEDEIADVMAASSIVTANLHLDQERMIERSKQKIALFTYWQGGGKDPKLKKKKNAL